MKYLFARFILFIACLNFLFHDNAKLISYGLPEGGTRQQQL